MDRQSLTVSIAKNLNLWTDLIKMTTLTGHGSYNKTSEFIVRDLLNKAFNYNLISTDLLATNYPAIDLIDESSKICIQVTSNNDVEKIKQTLDVFLSKKLNSKFERVIIFLLSQQKDYNKKNFDSFFKKLKRKHKSSTFTFDIHLDVWDKNTLFSHVISSFEIYSLFDINKLIHDNIISIEAAIVFDEYNKKLAREFLKPIMDDETGLCLNDIYIDPNFSIYRQCCTDETSYYDERSLRNEFVSLEDPISIHTVFNSFLTKSDEGLKFFKQKDSRVICVLGYPGQGKTSFCRRLAYDLINSGSKTPVFYLKLKDVSNTKMLIDNPLNVIKDEIELELEQTIPKSTLKDSVIILDGLDELYMKDNLQADDIERFCKELIRESEKHRYFKIILTSRYGYIDLNKLYKENVLVISIDALTTSQQKYWVKSFKVFHPESWISESKIDYFNREHQYRYIAELLDQPLLLYIISTLEEELKANDDRTKVYNKLFDQIIDRKYSKDGQIDLLKGVTKEDLRALLRHIAFLIHANGNGYINSDDLLKQNEVIDFVKKIGHNNNLQGTLKGVLISFYFKENNSQNQYNPHNNFGIEFFHKSLQEYLVSEKIVESCFEEILNKDSKDRYVLKTEQEMLQFFNQLFGQQFLSYEIGIYISRLLDLKETGEKHALSERMTEHIDYFFRKDFVYEYKQDDLNLFEISLRTFGTFWFVLQKLGLNKNYITTKERAIKILNYFSNTKSSNIPDYFLIVSHQRFEDVYLHGILGNSHEYTMRNVTIINSTVVNHSFFHNNFFNSNFHDVDLENIDVFMGDFVNCSFVEGSIDHFRLLYSEVKNCVFKNLKIASLEIPNKSKRVFKKGRFLNVIFDISSFNELLESKPTCSLRSCKIEFDEVEFDLPDSQNMEKDYQVLKNYVSQWSFYS